jgi:hypothetical protein
MTIASMSPSALTPDELLAERDALTSELAFLDRKVERTAADHRETLEDRDVCRARLAAVNAALSDADVPAVVGP